MNDVGYIFLDVCVRGLLGLQTHIATSNWTILSIAIFRHLYTSTWFHHTHTHTESRKRYNSIAQAENHKKEEHVLVLYLA